MHRLGVARRKGELKRVVLDGPREAQGRVKDGGLVVEVRVAQEEVQRAPACGAGRGTGGAGRS